MTLTKIAASPRVWKQALPLLALCRRSTCMTQSRSGTRRGPRSLSDSPQRGRLRSGARDTTGGGVPYQ